MHNLGVARLILGWDIRVLAFHLGSNRDAVSKVERGVQFEFRDRVTQTRALEFILYAYAVRDARRLIAAELARAA